MNNNTWNRLTRNLQIKQRFNQILRWANKHGYIEIKSDDLTIARFKRGDHIVRFDFSDGSFKSE